MSRTPPKKAWIDVLLTLGVPSELCEVAASGRASALKQPLDKILHNEELLRRLVPLANPVTVLPGNSWEQYEWDQLGKVDGSEESDSVSAWCEPLRINSLNKSVAASGKWLRSEADPENFVFNQRTRARLAALVMALAQDEITGQRAILKAKDEAAAFRARYAEAVNRAKNARSLALASAAGRCLNALPHVCVSLLNMLRLSATSTGNRKDGTFYNPFSTARDTEESIIQPSQAFLNALKAVKDAFLTVPSSTTKIEPMVLAGYLSEKALSPLLDFLVSAAQSMGRFSGSKDKETMTLYCSCFEQAILALLTLSIGVGSFRHLLETIILLMPLPKRNTIVGNSEDTTYQSMGVCTKIRDSSLLLHVGELLYELNYITPQDTLAIAARVEAESASHPVFTGSGNSIAPLRSTKLVEPEKEEEEGVNPADLFRTISSKYKGQKEQPQQWTTDELIVGLLSQLSRLSAPWGPPPLTHPSGISASYVSDSNSICHLSGDKTGIFPSSAVFMNGAAERAVLPLAVDLRTKNLAAVVEVAQRTCDNYLLYSKNHSGSESKESFPSPLHREEIMAISALRLLKVHLYQIASLPTNYDCDGGSMDPKGKTGNAQARAQAIVRARERAKAVALLQKSSASDPSNTLPCVVLPVSDESLRRLRQTLFTLADRCPDDTFAQEEQENRKGRKNTLLGQRSVAREARKVLEVGFKRLFPSPARLGRVEEIARIAVGGRNVLLAKNEMFSKSASESEKRVLQAELPALTTTAFWKATLAEIGNQNMYSTGRENEKPYDRLLVTITGLASELWHQSSQPLPNNSNKDARKQNAVLSTHRNLMQTVAAVQHSLLSESQRALGDAMKRLKISSSDSKEEEIRVARDGVARTRNEFDEWAASLEAKTEWEAAKNRPVSSADAAAGRRRSYDGKAYTKEEFERYYAYPEVVAQDEWDASVPLDDTDEKVNNAAETASIASAAASDIQAEANSSLRKVRELLRVLSSFSVDMVNAARNALHTVPDPLQTSNLRRVLVPLLMGMESLLKLWGFGSASAWAVTSLQSKLERLARSVSEFVRTLDLLLVSNGKARTLAWLIDLEMIGGSLLSALVASMLAGPPLDASEEVACEWLDHALFRGGIENIEQVEKRNIELQFNEDEKGDETLKAREVRARQYLTQIMNREGAGGELVARMEKAAPIRGLQKRVYKKKEVQTAVRAVFAALLKHSSSAYATSFDGEDCPSNVVALWKRCSVQLCKWMQQQRNALQLPYSDLGGTITSRAQFLLELRPGYRALNAGSGALEYLNAEEKNVSNTKKNLSAKLLRGVSSLDVRGDARSNQKIKPDEDAVRALRDALAFAEEDKGGLGVHGLPCATESEIQKKVMTFVQKCDRPMKVMRNLLIRRYRRANSRALGFRVLSIALQQVRLRPLRRLLLHSLSSSVGQVHYSDKIHGCGFAPLRQITHSYFELIGILLGSKELEGKVKGDVTDINATSSDPMELLLSFSSIAMPYSSDEDWRKLGKGKSDQVDLLGTLRPLLFNGESSIANNESVAKNVKDSNSSSKFGPWGAQGPGEHGYGSIEVHGGTGGRGQMWCAGLVQWVGGGSLGVGGASPSDTSSIGGEAGSNSFSSGAGRQRHPCMSVGLGPDFALLLSQGRPYTAGRNAYGCCGLDSWEPEAAGGTPRACVGFEKGEKQSAVVEVAVSQVTSFSVALNAEGRVFTCGCNFYGQLGHSGTRHVAQLTAVDGLLAVQNRKVVRIAVGGTHVLALTKGDELFSWGRNNHGQLGIGANGAAEFAGQRGPERVDLLCGRGLIDIAAGGSHSAAVAVGPSASAQTRERGGHLFSWGNNDYGQLGLTPFVQPGQNHDAPQLVRALQQKHYRVTKVVCGVDHTGVIISGGGVLCCGLNEDSQCGAERKVFSKKDTKKACCPDWMQLPLPGPASAIALGPSYCVAVLRNTFNGWAFGERANFSIDAALAKAAVSQKGSQGENAEVIARRQRRLLWHLMQVLGNIKCSDTYVNSLQAAGYGSVSRLKKATDAELNSLGLKRGHRRLLLHHVKQIKCSPSGDPDHLTQVHGWGKLPGSMDFVGRKLPISVVGPGQLPRHIARPLQTSQALPSSTFDSVSIRLSAGPDSFSILRVPAPVPTQKRPKAQILAATNVRLKQSAWVLMQSIAAGASASHQNYAAVLEAEIVKIVLADLQHLLKPISAMSQSVSANGDSPSFQIKPSLGSSAAAASEKVGATSRRRRRDLLVLLLRMCEASPISRVASMLAEPPATLLLLEILRGSAENYGTAVLILRILRKVLPLISPTKVGKLLRSLPAQQRDLGTVYSAATSLAGLENFSDDKVGASFLLQIIGFAYYQPLCDRKRKSRSNFHSVGKKKRSSSLDSKDDDDDWDSDEEMEGSSHPSAVYGTKDQMMVASEVVALLRSLLERSASKNGEREISKNAVHWGTVLNSVLVTALTDAFPGVVNGDDADEEMDGDVKSTKDTQTVVGDRKFTNTEGRDEKKLRKKREAFARDQASRRRVWRVLGALAVLGGVTEVPREGGKVLISLDDGALKQVGKVTHLSPFRVRVLLSSHSSSAESSLARETPGSGGDFGSGVHQRLAPRQYVSVSPKLVHSVSDVSVPTAALTGVSLILTALYHLALESQHQGPDSRMASLLGSLSPDVFSDLRMRACKAIGILLRSPANGGGSTSICMSSFVAQGYMPGFVALLRRGLGPNSNYSEKRSSEEKDDEEKFFLGEADLKRMSASVLERQLLKAKQLQRVKAAPLLNARRRLRLAGLIGSVATMSLKNVWEGDDGRPVSKWQLLRVSITDAAGWRVRRFKQHMPAPGATREDDIYAHEFICELTLLQRGTPIQRRRLPKSSQPRWRESPQSFILKTAMMDTAVLTVSLFVVNEEHGEEFLGTAVIPALAAAQDFQSDSSSSRRFPLRPMQGTASCGDGLLGVVAVSVDMRPPTSKEFKDNSETPRNDPRVLACERELSIVRKYAYGRLEDLDADVSIAGARRRKHGGEEGSVFSKRLHGSGSGRVLTWDFNGSILGPASSEARLALLSMAEAGEPVLPSTPRWDKVVWDEAKNENSEKVTLKEPLLLPALVDAESHDVDDNRRRYSSVPEDEQGYSWLRLEHGFGGNGGGVYLNEYTLLLDVKISESSLRSGNGPDSVSVPLLSLLTDVTPCQRGMLYEWCITQSGAVCSGAPNSARSQSNVIRPDCWHRLALVAELEQKRVRFAVDGVIVTELHGTAHSGDDFKADIDPIDVEIDDRWTMSNAAHLLPLPLSSSTEGVHLSSLQLRPYALSSIQLRELGPAAAPGLAPSALMGQATAQVLAQRTGFSEAACLQALEEGAGQLDRAGLWLQAHRQRILGEHASLARRIGACLNFDADIVQHAIASEGDATGAILKLLFGSNDKRTMVALKNNNGGESKRERRSISGRVPLDVSMRGGENGGLPGTPVRPSARSENPSYEIVDRNASFYFGGFNGRMEDQSVVNNLQQQDDENKSDGESKEDVALIDTKKSTSSGAFSRMRGRETEAELEAGVEDALTSMGALQLRKAVRRLTGALFVAHVRESTVSLLQLSINTAAARSSTVLNTAVRSVEAADDLNFDEDTKLNSYTSSTVESEDLDRVVRSLVSRDAFGGRNFLREYLCAFPQALEKAVDGDFDSVSRGNNTSRLGAPLTVMREKLTQLIQSEKTIKNRNGDLAVVREMTEGNSDLSQKHNLKHVIVAEALNALVSMSGPPSPLETAPITIWTCIWKSDPVLGGGAGFGGNSGARGFLGGALWRGAPPNGFFLLGDVAAPASRGSPGGYGIPPLAVRGVPSTSKNSSTLLPALAKPKSFKRIWRSARFGQAVALWRMVPPKGYVALGCLATLADEDVSKDVYRCVREDLTAQSSYGSMLWRVAARPGDLTPHGLSMWPVGNTAECFWVALSSERPPSVEMARHLSCNLSVRGEREKHASVVAWLMRLLLSQKSDTGSIFPAGSEPVVVHALLVAADRSRQREDQWQRCLRLLALFLRQPNIGALSPWATERLSQLRDSLVVLLDKEADGAAVHSQQLHTLIEVIVAWRIMERNQIGATDVLSSAPADAHPTIAMVVDVAEIMAALAERSSAAWQSEASKSMYPVAGPLSPSPSIDDDYDDPNLEGNRDRANSGLSPSASMRAKGWNKSFGLLNKAMSQRAANNSRNRLDRCALPLGFLMADDMFQPFLLVQEAVAVECVHPYCTSPGEGEDDDEIDEMKKSALSKDKEYKERLKGTTGIPGALSLQVHFDRRCDSDAADMLHLFHPRGAGKPIAARSGCAAASEKLASITEGDEAYRLRLQKQRAAAGGSIWDMAPVRVQGDKVGYTFPVTQVWGLDESTKVKNRTAVTFDSTKRACTFVGNLNWQTVWADVVFAAGVQWWEVRVDRCRGGNIFFGVGTEAALKGVLKKGQHRYLGRDTCSWGWIGTGLLWHKGKTVRKFPAPSGFLKKGDIVRVSVDLRSGRGTLQISVNGVSLGTAFSGLPCGGKGGGVIPGFSLYDKEDAFTILRGSAPLPQTSDAKRRGMVGSLGGDEDDEDDVGDEEIPEEILKMAAPLLTMGYPLDSVIIALERTNNDVRQAAEYVLANQAELNALSQSKQEDRQRQLQRRSLRKEQTWVMSMAAAFHNIAGSKSTSTMYKDGTYGVRFLVVPEFAEDKLLSIAEKHKKQLRALQRSVGRWSIEQDSELIDYINNWCSLKKGGADPLHFFPGSLQPTAEALFRYKALRGIPLAQLQLRFLLLRNFNRRLERLLPLVDLSCDDGWSPLARQLRQLRGLIFSTVKSKMWNKILVKSHVAQSEQQSISINRLDAETFLQEAKKFAVDGGAIIGRDTNQIRDSFSQPRTVFGQLFKALHNLHPRELRHPEQAFRVLLSGEHADDSGGPYRVVMATACQELQSPAKVLPILIPSPNQKKKIGDNQDKFILNPSACSPQALEMFAFLGKMMGIALRTPQHSGLDLDIPAIVWKTLVKERPTWSDVVAIDTAAGEVMVGIEELAAAADVDEDDPDEIWEQQESWRVTASDLNLTQTVRGLDGKVHELVPGGSKILVKWSQRQQYIDAVKSWRISELDQQCAAMSRGLATQVPLALLSLFCWQELELMVCGRREVSMRLLKDNTVYGEGYDGGHPVIKHFWSVFSSLTHEQRQMYLRFCWGRSRLPASATEFKPPHKINRIDKGDGAFPSAHTCFFSIDLPEYSNPSVLREKLLYAISNCVAIDSDNSESARRAADLGRMP